MYEQLRDNEYSSWYNRPTMTSWENSYDYTRYSEVNTEICHQSNPSAQNYWSDTKFDWALSEVIKESFPELAQAALDLLKKKADEALVAEKRELQERLARIEALEEEMGA